jgi:hypothetical protein
VEELLDLDCNISVMEAYASFEYGFKLGALLMMEVLGEIKSLKLEGWCDLARSGSLTGGNPVWEDIAVSPVASLGACRVTGRFKRRRQGNRPEA